MKTQSFKTRLLVSIAIVFLISTISIVSINAYRTKKSAIEDAKISVNEDIDNHIREMKSSIDHAFEVMRVINNNIQISKDKLDRETVNAILSTTLLQNPTFLGSYTLWEPNAFDNKDKQFINKPGHDKTGRFIPYWTQDNTGKLRLDPLMGYETEGLGDYYLVAKKVQKEVILDPYLYPVSNIDVLLLSAIVPIIDNGEFKGIFGFDIEVSFIQSEILQMQKKIYNGNVGIEVISNRGVFTANTDMSVKLGSNIVDLDIEGTDDLLRKIQKGKSETKLNSENLVISKSIVFGKTETPWMMRVTIPYSEITKESNSTIIYSSVVGLVLFILGLLFIYILVSRLIQPLFSMVEQTKKIVKGDLTGNISIVRNDEIGNLGTSFNTMIQKIRDIILTISESTNTLVTGSSQISSTAQTLAQGANEQAASSEQISSSVEEMLAGFQENSLNAIQTQKIAIDSAEGIIKVSEATEKSISAIREIAAKISIINDIAEKTDILAINAAIEAARAGEHGKGFAVVAAEVRKLAEVSQKSAKQINDLSHTSLNVTEDAGRLMQGIIPNIQKTAQLVQEIAASSLEQSTGATQISEAVEQLSQVIQQNSSAAEEMSAGSEELAGQSERLKSVIAFFNIGDHNIHEAITPNSKNITRNYNSNKSNGVNLKLSEMDKTVDGFEKF